MLRNNEILILNRKKKQFWERYFRNEDMRDVFKDISKLCRRCKRHGSTISGIPRKNISKERYSLIWKVIVKF